MSSPVSSPVPSPVPSPVSLPEPLWTQTYEVYSFLVSRQGGLSLYGLLNILQDASVAHAQSLGHGMRATHERKALWVLTRQKLAMSDWPKWTDRIRVETWVRPATGPFVVRDFFIFNESGRLIGESTTSWVRLTTDTHKPIREPLTDVTAGTGQCSFDAEKIPVRHENLSTLAKFEVRNSDIDGNQHVNNTRYAQWVLDAIPIASHSLYILDDYSVNFLGETRLGDVVEIQAQADEGYYHGQRLSDRKILFTVQLKARPAPDA